MSSDTLVRQADRALEFAESYARAGEPLGPQEFWPAGLTALVNVMLHSNQAMLIAWGHDFVALYNSAHAALIGDAHPATFGRPLFEVWSDASNRVEACFREALRGRCMRADRLAIPVTRGGRTVSAYFDSSYTPIPDGDGFGGVLCLSTEITANVLAEQSKAVLLELSDRSRGVDDPACIVLAAVETLGRTLKANRVGYGEVQADGQDILLEASYVDGVKTLHGLFPLESFGLDTIAAHRRGEIVAHDDVHGMPDVQDTWSAIETRAFVSVPLIRDGRFRASLYVNFRKPHIWSPEEIALIEETGDRIWDSLERARAEKELRSSEARFRGAVSAVQGVLWTNNAHGEMKGEQAAWGALTGQTMREYQGYGWAAAVHPEDAESTVAAWREAVEARKPFIFEHRVRNRDGAWRNFSIRAMPIIDAGEVREWVGVHTDITEQRMAEVELRRSNSALKARIDEERALNERLIAQGEELRRAQQSLSAIFGASSEGLTLCRLMTDESGRAVDYQVLDVNPAHRELTGATRESMLAKPVSQIAPPIDPRWIPSAEKAVRSGKSQAFEVRSPATGRWLDVRVSPVGDNLFAQTFIDVTSRHIAEDERRRLVEEMNHRVMNNFQMVAGVLELQARRASSPDVRNALQTAVQRVSSLSELHQSLAISPDSVAVDLGVYLTTICEKLRATIHDPARIVLKVSVCDAKLDSALAVPLGFMVNELVTNAVKYAFPEPTGGEINVVFAPDGDRGYQLVIADSGKGIPDVAKTKGTGLGMRLVHAFVAQIAGTLDVQHGNGVTYKISVPSKTAEPDRITI